MEPRFQDGPGTRAETKKAGGRLADRDPRGRREVVHLLFLSLFNRVAAILKKSASRRTHNELIKMQ